MKYSMFRLLAAALSILAIALLAGSALAQGNSHGGGNSNGEAQWHLGQVDKMIPADGAKHDWFGWSIALHGGTAIVGAPRDDDNGIDSGSAYLFDVNLIRQTGKLLPQDGAAGDYFGRCVAVSGTHVIVGSHGDDDNGDQSGSAYLFEIRTGKQTTKLVPSDGAAGDHFGLSVGISGNITIVGAPHDDNSDGSTGSAYLFDTFTGKQIAKLFPGDGGLHDGFGRCVAISGTTAIVGAPGHDANGISYSGAAYVFDTRTGLQTLKLIADDGAAGDRFGNDVAVGGTIAVVAARLDDDNGTNSGSAYLFNTKTGNQLEKLLPDDGAAGDQFGGDVATDGKTAIVGAQYHRNGVESGSAYLFDITTRQIAKLVANDEKGSGGFGCAVAIARKVAVVGARNGTSNRVDSGSAFRFTAR